MTDALFDPDQYTAPGAKPRAAVAATAGTPPAETVAVTAGHPWNLVVKGQGGIVHAYVGPKQERRGRELVTIHGSAVTYCGQLGAPRTFAPDELVQGCAACIRAGAPRTGT